jgi:hypothetical protein
MSKMPLHTIVALKAFGDFIIARWALRQLDPNRNQVALVMGDHLTDLDAALGTYTHAYRLTHCEGDVPAMYDIKRHGVWRGIHSASRLRRLVKELNLSSAAALVFDNVGLRERFISSVHPCVQLPQANNIYLSYQQLLGLPCMVARPPSPVGSGRSRSLGIFPGSRIGAKTLPASVIENLVDTGRHHDFTPTVFTLEGEKTNLPPSLESAVVLPRRFDAMARAVQSVDAVISADSMPAHMAEYFDKPVFVVSPVANTYWLPLSCIADVRWALFDELNVTSGSLQRFLSASESSCEFSGSRNAI